MNEKGNMYALAALRDKRATIAGEIVSLKRQIRHKQENLRTVDDALNLLDPDYDANTVRPKRLKHVNLFRTGELSRLVLGAFRKSEYVTLKMVVDRIVAMDGYGEDARRAIHNRVRSSLAYQVKRGKVIKSGEGATAQWRLESGN